MIGIAALILIVWVFSIGMAYMAGVNRGFAILDSTYKSTITSYKSTVEQYKLTVAEQHKTIGFWKGMMNAIASQQPVLPDGKGRKP